MRYTLRGHWWRGDQSERSFADAVSARSAWCCKHPAPRLPSEVVSCSVSDTGFGRSSSFPASAGDCQPALESLDPAGSAADSLGRRITHPLPAIARLRRSTVIPAMFTFLSRNAEVLVGIWELMGITSVKTRRTGPYQFEAIGWHRHQVQYRFGLR